MCDEFSNLFPKSKYLHKLEGAQESSVNEQNWCQTSHGNAKIVANNITRLSNYFYLIVVVVILFVINDCD